MIRSDRVATALLTGEFAADVTGAATPLSAADAALTRRSVRAYRDEPVTEAEIARLLTLTGRAPSAFNVQPWRFVVVRDADTKAALREVAYGQKQVTEAPALIVMYADIEDALAHLDEVVHPGLPAEKREATMAVVRNNLSAMPPEARAQWANAQANIALGYLLLIARSEGFDTSPMLGFDATRVKALLDIPSHATVTAMVALGRGAEEGFVSHRHDVARVATFR